MHKQGWVWVVAVVLTKDSPDKTTTSQTISWTRDCTENEAVGRAVRYAHEQKPGFAITMWTTAQIMDPIVVGNPAEI